MKARRGAATATMTEENLSTFPGQNDPIVPVEAGADVLLNNKVSSSITLHPTWCPKGLTVPLPLRLWNARCLILNGLATADVLDEQFKTKNRKVQRVDHNLNPDDNGSQAWVQLYGSDYTATTLGPFKSVFTLTWVKGELPGVFYFMWSRYFGTSLINKEFKEKVWGIVPNRLAVIETAYAGKRKAVRLLEDGRTALRMMWNSARFPDLVEVPQHLAFKTVAPARHDGGENDVELGAIALRRGDSDDARFPFDSREDDFYFDPTSELGQDLKAMDFTPASWQCMLNYGGVVKIYDERGGGTLLVTAPRGGNGTRPNAKRSSGRR